IAKDLRAGGGAHALRREQILDAERNAVERAALAPRLTRVGLTCHRPRLIRRLQHIGVEETRALHRLKMRFGQFDRGQGLRREAVAGLGNRQRRQIGHFSTGVQTKGEWVDKVLSADASSAQGSRSQASRAASSSFFITSAITLSWSTGSPPACCTASR